MAKLHATVVLPSDGAALVTSSFRNGRSGLVNMRLVRTERAASAMPLSGRWCTTSSGAAEGSFARSRRLRFARFLLGKSSRLTGRRPRNVTPSFCSTSSGVLSVLSSDSRPHATATPRSNPTKVPNITFSLVRGEIGAPGRPGGSIAWMLLMRIMRARSVLHVLLEHREEALVLVSRPVEAVVLDLLFHREIDRSSVGRVVKGLLAALLALNG